MNNYFISAVYRYRPDLQETYRNKYVNAVFTDIINFKEASADVIDSTVSNFEDQLTDALLNSFSDYEKQINGIRTTDNRDLVKNKLELCIISINQLN